MGEFLRQDRRTTGGPIAERVTSADGTSIAFTRSGTGAPLVLIDGAGGHRGFGPLVKLPALLANERQVVHYDRRGRGRAVRYFLVDTVGSPAFVPWMMRLIPGGPWKPSRRSPPPLHTMSN